MLVENQICYMRITGFRWKFIKAEHGLEEPFPFTRILFPPRPHSGRIMTRWGADCHIFIFSWIAKLLSRSTRHALDSETQESKLTQDLFQKVHTSVKLLRIVIPSKKAYLP